MPGQKCWIPWFALALACIPSAILAWRCRHFEHLGCFHDDGIYWVTAKALAHGEGYRILNLPESPWQTKYPPLFPLLLSVVWRLFPRFPDNLPWAMLVSWSMLPLVAWTNLKLLQAWGCARDRAVLISAWIVLNPYIAYFSVNLMAELLVTALIAGCLLLAKRALARDCPWTALGAGAFAGSAYLTKTAAMPLLLAGLVWFGLRRRFRLAVCFAAPMLAAMAGWLIWSVRHLIRSSDIVTIYYTNYLGDFLYDLRGTDLPLFLSKNIRVLLASAGNLIIPDCTDIPVIGEHLGRLLGLFAIAGLVRNIRRRGMSVEHWFTAGYFVALLVWHYPPNERFLVPVALVFAFGFAVELEHLATLIKAACCARDSGQRIAAGAFMAIFGAAGLWAAVMALAAHVWTLPESASRYRNQFTSDQQVYSWMRAHLPGGANVLTYVDVPVYLYTGHRASRPVNFPKQYYRDDKEAIRQSFRSLPKFLQSHNLRYLLLRETDLDQDPYVRAAFDWEKLFVPKVYPKVYSTAEAAVYRAE